MRWLTMALCILLVALGMSLSVPLVALAKDSEMRASDPQYSTAGRTVSHQRDSEQRDSEQRGSEQRDSAADSQYAATEGESAADSQYAATEGESAADSQYADNSPLKPPPEPSKVLPADSRAGNTNSRRSVSQG